MRIAILGLTNRMWFSLVYSLIDNDTRHHSGQNLLGTHSAAPRESTTFWPLWWRVSWSKCRGLTRRSRVSPQQILTTVMTRIAFDKTIYHAKPHSIYFLPQYQRNEIFVLTIQNTDSDLKVHTLHYANELHVRVRLFQKLLQTRLICWNNSKKCLGKE